MLDMHVLSITIVPIKLLLVLEQGLQFIFVDFDTFLRVSFLHTFFIILFSSVSLSEGKGSMMTR